MRILGIDPGTAIMGWGVIEQDGRKLVHIAHGAVLTKAGTPMPERLASIYTDLTEVMDIYKPEAAVIEELFFNNNAKTAIAVGQARGVALLVAQQHKLLIYEYTPLEVKNALSGYGRAYKKQIQELVKLMLMLPVIPTPDDAADALALAITHTQYAASIRIREMKTK